MDAPTCFQGGGHSFLSPSFGLGVDNLLEMDIITPDGKLRTISECSNPDLFWAVRYKHSLETTPCTHAIWCDVCNMLNRSEAVVERHLGLSPLQHTKRILRCHSALRSLPLLGIGLSD